MRKYWGYNQFRPLQLEAMLSGMARRDSLVIFPTGAGKSLCYQVPSLCQEGLTVVVSPLISLMKDQVDALLRKRVPAACLHSHCTDSQQVAVLRALDKAQLKLLYVAPERLLMESMLETLRQVPITAFAIDESHCVSQWGHDFRKDYRGLSVLKDEFPRAAVHAYTATATEQVRADISQQLKQLQPLILVGDMDRPNLSYNICRRGGDAISQVSEVIKRYREASGIVYCISRRNVEKLAEDLQERGFSALPYHAGMTAEDRRDHQEAFLQGDVKTIVATVAFGMGIDKSNVRYVVHASMPQSIEAYQQETGRAGRDGLPSECWMFFSPGDYGTWERLISQSDSTIGLAGKRRSLDAMYEFCTSSGCRRRALLNYFGQPYTPNNCGACDGCTGGAAPIANALDIAQTILLCIQQTGQCYPADYVAGVLLGRDQFRIMDNRHDRLRCYGVLRQYGYPVVRDWIEQLQGQWYLVSQGSSNVLQVTQKGEAVIRGESVPRLSERERDGRRRPR
jgi:ATP-dependent DNA helicase RecQ